MILNNKYEICYPNPNIEIHCTSCAKVSNKNLFESIRKTITLLALILKLIMVK